MGDEFWMEDPEIKALQEDTYQAQQDEHDKKLRRKSMLPLDPNTVGALLSHVTLDQLTQQRGLEFQAGAECGVYGDDGDDGDDDVGDDYSSSEEEGAISYVYCVLFFFF